MQKPDDTAVKVEESASALQSVVHVVEDEKVLPTNAGVVPITQNRPQEIALASPVQEKKSAEQRSDVGENDGENRRVDSSKDKAPLESEGFPSFPLLENEFSADLSTIDIRASSFSPTSLSAGTRRPLFNQRDEATNLADLSNPADVGLVFASGFDSNESEKQKRPNRFLIGLMAGIAMFVAGGSGLWYGREQIFTTWPALRGHLADLGLPVVNLTGSLRFSEITTLVVTEKGARVFIVKGIMENVASISVRLPSLRLIFRDEKRHIVRKGEAVDPPVSTLSPGEKVRFTLRQQSPPTGAAVDIGLERT